MSKQINEQDLRDLLQGKFDRTGAIDEDRRLNVEKKLNQVATLLEKKSPDVVTPEKEFVVDTYLRVMKSDSYDGLTEGELKQLNDIYKNARS